MGGADWARAAAARLGQRMAGAAEPGHSCQAGGGESDLHITSSATAAAQVGAGLLCNHFLSGM